VSLADIKLLIAEIHGTNAGEVWAKFTVQDEDKRVLAEAGKKVLQLFPGRTPRVCVMMSAVFSLVLDALHAKPSYVVAGSL
jgi:hypothetical protein